MCFNRKLAQDYLEMIFLGVLYDFQRKNPCIYSSEPSGEIRVLRRGINCQLYLSQAGSLCNTGGGLWRKAL